MVKVRLFYGRVTNAGLVHLEELKYLRTLGLGFITITDAGIEHLKVLKNLESRSVPKQISKEAIVHLKKVNPFIETPFASEFDYSLSGWCISKK